MMIILMMMMMMMTEPYAYDDTDDDFDELMSLLDRSSSMEYAEILVRTHLERAQAELNRFPDSDAKEMMLLITNIVKDRHA